MTGQFNGSLTDLANMTQISGVYLLDPASKQKFEVLRPSQTQVLCSKIERPFDAGRASDPGSPLRGDPGERQDASTFTSRMRDAHQ